MKNEKRIMKNGRSGTIFYFFTFFCSLLLVFSCENPAASKDKPSSIPAGKGSFSLTLSEADRTILPVTPNTSDFAKYNLNFTPTNGGSAENADRTNATLATEPVFLDTGTYKLVVSAYKDNNKTQLAAQGTLNNVVITAGKNTSAAVTLEALFSGGTGTFRWEITLPSGVTANMIIKPGNTGGTSQQTVTLSPPKATGSRTLNSGQYSLTFNLTKTDGKSVVWNELLYVYQNLESVFTFTFTDDHLNDSNFTVTYNRNNNTSNLTQSVLHGATLTAPTAPTRSGYVFSGWYTDNDTFIHPYDFDNVVIESFTLYAKWNCTVTFDANGGSGTPPAAQTVTAGSSITLPGGNGLQKDFSTFGGWNTNSSGTGTTYQPGDSYTPTGNITLYVKWDTITGLANKLAWLQTNAQSNGSYVLEVNADESIEPHSLSYSDRSNITVILVGVGINWTVSLLSNGSVFTVSSGVTLVLDNNITLQGHSSNTNSMIRVKSGGMFRMYTGSTITGNTWNSGSGGVSVEIGGTFTMNGGEISGNTASSGGGVYVTGGTFTMNGGEISGNTASSGGGVYVNYYYGTFTMSGGEISGNKARSGGGGVYVNSGTTYGDSSRITGTFTMTGGEISGNTASIWGGGVYVNGGTFTMTGGEISGNTSSLDGGGVYVNGGTFTMNGGEISGNTTADSSGFPYGGGGVYVNGGTFTMTGGKISGNTASSLGGGVYVTGGAAYKDYGTFTMTGGEISGNTASSLGGGVYVDNGGFLMYGGTVYGGQGYGTPSELANVANRGASLYNDGIAKYGNGTNILPHTDGETNYTNNTISITIGATIPVISVSLNKSTTSLSVGTSETLTATIMPSNATNKNVTWSSSNTTVATVSAGGVVTAIALGSTTITVTTVDGGYQANCAINVSILLPVPNTPTISYMGSGRGLISIEWSFVPGATGCYVYRSSSASGTYTRIGGTEDRGYSDRGLPDNTTYYYKVSAYNSVGESDLSSYRSGTTCPPTVTNITGTSTQNSITLSWAPVTGAVIYWVFVYPAGIGGPVGIVSTTSFTHTGLEPDRIYEYGVAAVNSAGVSSGVQSDRFTVKTKP